MVAQCILKINLSKSRLPTNDYSERVGQNFMVNVVRLLYSFQGARSFGFNQVVGALKTFPKFENVSEMFQAGAPQKILDSNIIPFGFLLELCLNDEDKLDERFILKILSALAESDL